LRPVKRTKKPSTQRRRDRVKREEGAIKDFDAGTARNNKIGERKKSIRRRGRKPMSCIPWGECRGAKGQYSKGPGSA